MSMKMVCNRCNKVKEDGEHFNRIRYICGEPELMNEEYDLCPECSKQFERFMNGCEVEEEDPYKDSKPSAIVIHKMAGGTYGIENVPKEDDQEEHANESIDKEESDLSVKTHTNAAGVTVPDSKPWDLEESDPPFAVTKVCPRCWGKEGFDIRGKCILCNGTGRIKG